jgi:hypothetical protein
VERVSRPLLERVSRLPAPVPFLVMLALLLVGLFRPGPVGAVCTGIVAVFVAWLLYLSWPRLTSTEQLGRAAVLLLAIALFVVQVVPHH